MVDDVAKFFSQSSFYFFTFDSITSLLPSLRSLWLLQSAFDYVWLVSTLFDYVDVNLVLITIFLAVSFFNSFFFSLWFRTCFGHHATVKKVQYCSRVRGGRWVAGRWWWWWWWWWL